MQAAFGALLHPKAPDEPYWRFLPWVLMLAFAARAMVALAGDFTLHPDEIMQYLEPAHWLVFGNGIIHWEFFCGGRTSRNSSFSVRPLVPPARLRPSHPVISPPFQQVVGDDRGRRLVVPQGGIVEIDQAKIGSNRFQIKHIIVNPGPATLLQTHRHRSEHWVVVCGTARVTRGEETFTLSENESAYIPAGTKHRLENPAETPLELLEVHLGEDDITCFEDVYGRSEPDLPPE